MRKFGLVATASLLFFSTAINARKPPQIAGLELQQMQSREYETSNAISFPAVMTVLQDSGYRILSADKDTGLITGSASTNSHMNYNLLLGFGRSKKTPMVSAFIEPRGGGSRIRLSFVMAKTKSSIYGMSASDEEPIVDPAVYRDAFEKIDKEMFVRLSLEAPKSSQIPTLPKSVQTPPAATTVVVTKP